MKNLLIVGASRGIGLSLARRLGPEEKVYTVSRTLSPELERLSTHHFPEDVAGGPLAFVDALPDVLHGVVYCPGSLTLKGLQRLTEEDFLGDFRQNVLGAFRVLKATQSRLQKAQGASVVLFSTVAVRVGMGFHASIATAKAAVEGLGRSLAAEWAPLRIRVNVIAPSLTQTPLVESLINTPEKLDASARRHPLQRVGSADEVAALAAFLLGDEASWMTGQVLGVDGGLGSVR